MLLDRQRLALRQQALVDSIFSFEQPHLNNRSMERVSRESMGHGFSEGLSIYQNNLKAIANRALTIAYPVLEQLVGESTLRLLAQRLLKTEKNCSGDWGDWGSNLASTIQESELADDFPFLIEVATFEWRRHQANRASEIRFDRDSLALLESCDPADLHLQLPSSLHLQASDFPVDTLWQAHQDSNNREELLKTLTHELKNTENKYYYIIFSTGLHASHRRIDQQEHQWISSILSGRSLHELLTQQPSFDFSNWLKKAIENHYITQFNAHLNVQLTIKEHSD